MRGKLWFIGGVAAGFVLGARAGREKYEEIVVNARKVWENPTVQEAAGVAQAKATQLVSDGKDKLGQSKLGDKLGSTGSKSTSATELTSADDPFVSTTTTSSSSSLGGSSNTGTTY
ncbi:MAG TPA: hypothetical protein VF755_22650 [Catenuloplanes sp.]|jgi:hypothetical protein